MRYPLLTYFLKAWLIIYYSPSTPDPVDSVSSNSGKAIHSSKNLIQNAGLANFLFCEGWKMDLWKQGSLSKRGFMIQRDLSFYVCCKPGRSIPFQCCFFTYLYRLVWNFSRILPKPRRDAGKRALSPAPARVRKEQAEISDYSTDHKLWIFKRTKKINTLLWT